MSYNDVLKGKEIIVWGVGEVFNKYFDFLDPDLNIVAIADNSVKKIGKKYTSRSLVCISPQEIKDNQTVIIAIKSKEIVKSISSLLDERKISYCHIFDAIKFYEEKMLVSDKNNIKLNEEDGNNIPKICKYIDCMVPVGRCNLKCKYCYVGKSEGTSDMYFYHSPKFIRKALSKKRLKGIALINFCSDGETLLCKDIVKIVEELINEGHYVSIVTNGTVNRIIDELININVDLTHIFVKFSFHYMEFKRLGLLDNFVKNVNKVYKAGCSISIEITPSDDMVPYIDEIKEFSINAFGALPHITVTRDESVKSFKILSGYTYEEYKTIWGTFDSEMFDFKMKNVGIRRFENCMAGVWSLHLNLESGDLYKCTHNPYLDNIYEDLESEINLEPVMDRCCLPYCYNCHSYLALGTVPEIDAPTYYEVRDRKMKNGEHWVRGDIKEIFEQKLYVNNN